LHPLYDKLTPGGVVVFDDYGSPKWPGAQRAVDEFFASRAESIERFEHGDTASWHIRKQVAQQGRVA
jgi:hypothetical protein